MDKKYIDMLHQCVGFDWDDENIDKNWHKRRVTPAECEQIFFNQQLVVQDDAKLSA